MGQNFDSVFHIDHAKDAVDRFINENIIISHNGQPECTPLPEILMVNLGNGNVEFIPDFIFQSLDDLTLILEGTTIRNKELYFTYAYNHSYATHPVVYVSN